MKISIKGEKRARAPNESSSPLAGVISRVRARLKGVRSKTLDAHTGEQVQLLKRTSTSQGPSTQVLQVNGQRYVSNLLWQQLSSLSESSSEIKSFLAARNMNLYTTFEGTVLQAGFAQVNLEHKKMYAGAASLAAALSERVAQLTWLAVLQIDAQSSVLVALNEGRIIPGFDKIGEHAQIVASAAEILHVYDWEQIYTDLPDAQTLFQGTKLAHATLIELLSEPASRAARVRLVINRRKEIILGSLVLTVVVGTVFYGYKRYEDAQLQRLRAQSAQQTASVAEKKKFEVLRKAREELEKSALKPLWQDKPPALEWVQHCANAIGRAPINLGGWTLEEATCQGADLLLHFKRNSESTIGDFALQVKALVASGHALSFFIEDAKASVRMDLKTSELAKRTPAELLDSEDWRLKFVSQLQSVGAKYDYALTQNVAPKQPPWVVDAIGLDSIERAQPFWNNYSWSFSLAGLSAADILTSIGEMPGFTVDKIAVSMSGSNAVRWAWSASGEANVKKK